MEVTLDISDDLYRRVKARSALEGRPLRSVAVELFRKWLENPSPEPALEEQPPTAEEFAKYPWLAIAARYVNPGIRPDMDDIRTSIARAWADEAAGKLAPPASRS